MHIIIDGYNLIRQSVALRRYERFSLEEGRKALIRFTALYKKRKGHKVTVVFDGWEGGPAEEERDRQEGIYIVYSRRGEKADDVIKRMVQHRGEECVVVSSDRDIADFVSRRGGTAVSSQEFEALIDRVKDRMPDTQPRSDAGHDKGEDDVREGVKRKGPSRRLSRKKKAAIVKLRKL
jgi:predicted RNA-binding protein with PIN domain